jgi:hypothetical protein
MQKTKWMTLVGASLAVVSSTVLYLNFLLMMVLGGHGSPFYSSPYLSVWVLGVNLDSVLNDVGMLLVCGVYKTVSGSLAKQYTSLVSEAKKFTFRAAVVQPHPEVTQRTPSHIEGDSGGSMTSISIVVQAAPQPGEDQ